MTNMSLEKRVFLCFVILIFIYVYKMNKLDLKYKVDEDQDHFASDDTYYKNKESEE